ncbi:hypothetical protein CVT25_010287 [Psilocybe cyanescens]|uniref:Tc1-like transposase DDE domain-containing protein n=1 Tax=Psilocybe cyanescens TaxID=93625 RepID=A0A409XJ79_PSICY|nr:hypothetical protein CVT25_010287 [Psilocybe cyanescens]
MPPHLSQEIRQLMVVWSKDFKKSNKEIAELAGCCERTVQEVLHLERDPVIYLDEVHVRLIQYCNINVSLSTISHTLHKLALSWKQVSPAAAERNELLHATWQAAYAEIPADYIVWLDESSVDDHTNQQQMGWAQVGQACVHREFFVHGQRYSVLPALTCDSYIALDIFEGSVNKERFLAFLNEQLALKLNPYPGPNSVVILDNCTIHHDKDIERLIVHDCGAKLIHLPPYSPDYNPIEQYFSLPHIFPRTGGIEKGSEENRGNRGD